MKFPKKSPMEGKKHTDETKRKIGLACSKALKGRKLSEEHKRKIGIASAKRTGEKGGNWKGGKTTIHFRIRMSKKYADWRMSVFERDSYTCQVCNQRGGKLNVDHIKPFSIFPELRFELSNGRTLCVDCHRKTDTWGVKSVKLAKIYAI